VIRSLFAASGMLVRRRFRRDLGLLIVTALLLSFATLLAIAIPRSLESTIDSAARQAIDAVDEEADLVFTATVGTVVQGAGTSQQILDIAREAPGLLPPALNALTSEASATVITPRTTVKTDDGSRLNVQVALLTDEQASQFRVQGRVPRDDSPRIEVVISQETADTAHLKIGSVLPIGFGVAALDLVVVGIIVPNDPASIDAEPCLPVWCDLPYLWSPNELVSEDLERTTAITVLADPLSVDKVAALTIEPTDATVRIRTSGENATIDILSQAIVEAKSLQGEASTISGSSPVELTVRTRFGDSFDGLSTEIRAAVAQISLAVAGLLGVAIAVLVLLSRLLIGRRAGELALERARGASIGSMALRSLIESFIVTVVGVGFGLALATELVTSGIADVTPLLIIAAVGVFAAPVQSALAARSVVRRQPANRSDRADNAARARLRRIIIEVAILVVAGAALYTLRSRGVSAGTIDGIDPLVVTAPLLLAIVVTLVVIRLTPPVARLASRLGERSTGALGLLGAAQAGRTAAVLPLLALTLSFALAVSGGLLLDTVRTGQVDASWQRVGADVRVSGEVSESQVSEVATADGVTAAGSFVSEGGIEIAGADTFVVGTVVAVDEGYASVVESLPDYSDGPSDLRELGSDDAALPIVVSSALAPRLTGSDLTLRYAGQNVPVRVVGTENHGPRGYVSGPYIFIDRVALAERANKPLAATTLLVMGSGAAHAVANLDLTTLTRAGWLAERQSSALVSGVTTIMGWSSAAVALLALVTMIATVLATARGRGRTLSLLRTLGMPSRAGWWLALAELGPIVGSALLGGILAGVGIVLAIAPALGLSVLAGGVGDPALLISPVLVIGVAGGALALLAIAVVVEMFAHRRDRLSEVLRVGETV
jgi:putative ABC transport system permease protein